MKKNLVIASLAVSCVLAATALPAQIAPAPYITVHFDTIDPAQTEAWIENNKEWVEAFSKAKAGKDHYWRAYQSGFTYAWVADMPDYAYLDSAGEREKALGEKLGEGVMDELMAGGSATIYEHHSEIWKYEAEMSYFQEGFNPEGMNAINVAIDSIKAGKGDDFRKLVSEVVAAMKEADAPYNWFAYSIPFGKGSFAFVSWAEDRAALHAGPDMGKTLAEAVGEEKAKELFSRFMDCVAASEERDWKVRRDLAYVSDEMMDEKAMEGGGE